MFLHSNAVGDSEPSPGLTVGNLANSPSPSVDPQQRPEMLAPEHPDTPHATASGEQTVPSWEQSPLRQAGPSCTAAQGLSPSRLAGMSGTAQRGGDSPRGVAGASGTATQGSYSPQGIDEEDTEDSEDFIIPTSENNAEIVVAEAMKATERVNTVFTRIRASMNRMSLRMRELLIVHDKAAAEEATERIIDQTSMMMSATGSGAEECVRMTRSRVPGNRYSRPPLSSDIRENICYSAQGEQSDDSQPRCGCEACDIHVTEDMRMNSQESMRLRHDVSPLTTRHKPGIPESIERSRHSMTEQQSIDMNALRKEIKNTISATIKDKLRSDADSVTTVSHIISALDANAPYWSDLSNKATRSSRRALELQLKLAEEKVNKPLHEEAPEEALLEAAREACNVHFQLDQNTRLHEAGVMPEQQVRFSAATGRDVNCQGTPSDFCPEPFHPELSLVSTTLRERFCAGFPLSTFELDPGRVANIPSFALTDESPDVSEATAPESPSQQLFGISYGNLPAMTTKAKQLNTLELTLVEECLKTEWIKNQLQQLIALLNPARAASELAPPGKAPSV
ncbi:hypothetical protein M422DRAFT_253543 [Sphaerobolus stellatus SS14]|uniref:Uncharacterized protein n=1 Tax=Sphaerobolus stellatus (strain SS14) TaxID=990650 RepID=A0A0C9V8N2_SPHS4|nr:hypothetical protein M422DRAFT_253543 [Sphaerobolus stellatus SS14]